MRILFLTDDQEDYLADSILHGLKTINQIEVVDYPRKDCLYAQYWKLCNKWGTNSIRGGGFTLYGKLDSNTWEIDRSQIKRKLESKYFDVVIIANIWRQWGLIIQWKKLLKDQHRLIILDGDDDPRDYQNSGAKIRAFGLYPTLHDLLTKNSTNLFKRERRASDRRNARNSNIHKISFSIPKEWTQKAQAIKTKLFQAHIVDQEIALILRKEHNTGYMFTDEQSYHQDLNVSRYGITTKRAGWDCLRHYELAANGAIICFKDLDLKPKLCAPFDLVDGVNCLSYKNYNHLIDMISNIPQQREEELRENTREWARKSTTQIRAVKMLQDSGIDI